MIYFIQDQTANLIKVGFTGGDSADDRMKALQTGSPVGLVLLLTLPGERSVETQLHQRFAAARVHGEWFRPVPDLVQFMLEAKAAQAKQEARPKAPDPDMPWPLNIYLAGKVSQDCWRHSIVEGLSDAIDACPGRCGNRFVVEESMFRWPVLHRAILGEHSYVGPYFFNREQHVGVSCHGDDEHGCGAESALLDNGTEPHNWEDARQFVVAACLAAIQKADLVFAWIDSPDCYGTVAELGFAQAAHKTIWIAGPRRFRDLWFVYELSNLKGLGLSEVATAANPLQVLRDNLGELKGRSRGRMVYTRT